MAVPVGGVVQGDAVRLEPGEQVIADGPLLEARSLQLDESVLTGEADPVTRALGDEVRSGSYCLAGGGVYRADLVGSDAYASTLTETARAARRDLSPLQRDINRLLRLLVLVMVPIAVRAARRAALPQDPDQGGRVCDRHGRLRHARAGGSRAARQRRLRGRRRAHGTQGCARAAALGRRVARRRRRRVRRQDRHADRRHARARRDRPAPRPLRGRGACRARRVRDEGLAGRNPTADAIAKALGGVERGVQVEVPFSSRWKWSGLTLSSGETQRARARRTCCWRRSPTPLQIGALVDVRAREQRRVLLFARTDSRARGTR